MLLVMLCIVMKGDLGLLFVMLIVCCVGLTCMFVCCLFEVGVCGLLCFTALFAGMFR